MNEARALLLAGTGPLTALARALSGTGWLVVLAEAGHTEPGEPAAGAAARRALRSPGHRPADWPGQRAGPARVAVRWADPGGLAALVTPLLDGSATLLVSRLDPARRQPALTAVRGLLAPGGTVIEVREPGEGDTAGPGSAGHPTHLVTAPESEMDGADPDGAALAVAVLRLLRGHPEPLSR